MITLEYVLLYLHSINKLREGTDLLFFCNVRRGKAKNQTQFRYQPIYCSVFQTGLIHRRKLVSSLFQTQHTNCMPAMFLEETFAMENLNK